MKIDKLQKNVFITLFLIGIVANIEKGIIGVLGPYLTDPHYMSSIGIKTFSNAQFGLITTLFYASFIVMTFGAGYFVDKFGYSKFVPAALTILLVGCVFFGIAGYSSTSAIFILIPLARLVIGLGQAGYTNGAPPVIAKNYPAQMRGSVQGKVVSTAGIGAILCYLVFDQLVVAHDFRWMYFIMAALLLVALVMFWKLVPQDTKDPQAAANSPAEKVRFADAWTNRNTLVLAFALCLNNLIGVGLLTWANSMFRTTFNPPHWQQIIIMTVYGVTVFIATATGPDIISKYFPLREKFFMLITSVIGGVLLIGTVIFPNLWASAICLWLANLLIMWAFSGILVLPYRLIPLRIIGSAFAVINIGAFVGGMAQGWVLGALIDATGNYYSAFVVLAVLAVIGGISPYLLKDVDPNGVVAKMKTSSTK